MIEPPPTERINSKLSNHGAVHSQGTR
jgi:hypothetical protein